MGDLTHVPKILYAVRLGGAGGGGGVEMEGALDMSIDFTHRIQTQKGLNERLFILTRTRSMQIFGKILFIRPQNDT